MYSLWLDSVSGKGGYTLFNDKRNKREESDNIDYNLSLTAIVWKDSDGVWHLSQATSKYTLIKEIIINNKVKEGNYRLFDGSEYSKALEFKRQMQIKDMCGEAVY